MFISWSELTESVSLESRGQDRGTQRLPSVKYLFGDANIVNNFQLLEDDQKFLNDHFIHVHMGSSSSNKFATIFWSLISHFISQVRLLFVEKRKPSNFSNSEIRWREKSENGTRFRHFRKALNYMQMLKIPWDDRRDANFIAPSMHF